MVRKTVDPDGFSQTAEAFGNLNCPGHCDVKVPISSRRSAPCPSRWDVREGNIRARRAGRVLRVREQE